MSKRKRGPARQLDLIGGDMQMSSQTSEWVAGELGVGAEARSCTVYLNGGGFLASS
jgi:hypothetical protein